MPKVHIVGGGMAYVAMFNHFGWEVVEDWASSDLIQFTGGEDVNPALYGEIALDCTHFNEHRDTEEKLVYQLARDNNIPMAGICRGAQFLNVMNGGKLYQHVNGHGLAGTHPIRSVMGNSTIFVTSTHHQLMRPHPRGVLEGYAAGLSPTKYYMGEDGEVVSVKDDPVEAEVVWYEDTKCLCFQPHPEHFGAHSTRAYYEALLNKYILGE